MWFATHRYESSHDWTEQCSDKSLTNQDGRNGRGGGHGEDDKMWKRNRTKPDPVNFFLQMRDKFVKCRLGGQFAAKNPLRNVKSADEEGGTRARETTQTREARGNLENESTVTRPREFLFADL